LTLAAPAENDFTDRTAPSWSHWDTVRVLLRQLAELLPMTP
jgi:hypothetical protein